MLISYATRILGLAILLTPVALLIPWGGAALWGITLPVAIALAIGDFLDLLKRGL